MVNQQFTAKLLTDSIVEVTLADNVYLDVSVTDKIDQELNRLAPDRKLYQMVIAKGPYAVNPEMRHSFSKGDTGVKILGLAWVSPDQKANEEQEAIVSKLPIPVPMRFFCEREEAFAWLNGLASANK